ALEQQAEQRMQEPLNRDLILLVHHADPSVAQALTAEIGQQLQASQLYQQVRWSLDSDLSALRQQLLDGRLALQGAEQRRQLIEAPQAYLQARAQSLFDPFAGAGLVPLEQDWLGLASLAQQRLPTPNKISVDPSG